MEKNAIEKILDENNDEPIVLYDENDKETSFEQIAVIPLGEALYAILKPIDKMEGIADDEAIVFALDTDEDSDEVLTIVEEDAIIDAVFAQYNKLMDEAEGKA